jgi:hypothetical protein
MDEQESLRVLDDTSVSEPSGFLPRLFKTKIFVKATLPHVTIFLLFTHSAARSSAFEGEVKKRRSGRTSSPSA